MTNFFVSTDSTCDLYANEIEKLGVGYLPLTITIEENGETRFLQDKFQTYEEYVNFFEMLKNPALNIFTSKNNTEIHREYFEKLAPGRSPQHYSLHDILPVSQHARQRASGGGNGERKISGFQSDTDRKPHNHSLSGHARENGGQNARRRKNASGDR